MIVDHRNSKAIEVVNGKSQGELDIQNRHLKGRENVYWVTRDLCQPSRSVVKNIFPNAQIVADKFHVARLLGDHINRLRREIPDDKPKNPLRNPLLKNSRDLDDWTRGVIQIATGSDIGGKVSPIVAMNGELVAANAFGFGYFLEPDRCMFGRLLLMYTVADNFSAIDIHKDIKREYASDFRFQIRDVAAVNLIGTGGGKFLRFLARGSLRLTSGRVNFLTFRTW